jgi:RNA polymerase sigma-70 factor (ECF subfamily)
MASGQVPPDWSGLGKRDPKVLARFFEHYVDEVFDMAVKLCGERGLAEDLTQEVFARVIRAAKTFDPSRDPRPWLMAILYNLFKDRLRANERRVEGRSVALDALPQSRVSDPRDRPDDALMAKELSEAVQRAVLDLPSDQRIAVLLRDYRKMAHADIAAILGTTELAARKCYSRAIAALGKRLKGIAP